MVCLNENLHFRPTARIAENLGTYDYPDSRPMPDNGARRIQQFGILAHDWDPTAQCGLTIIPLPNDLAPVPNSHGKHHYLHLVD